MKKPVREYLSAPGGVILYLTDRCNFKCKYCFVNKNPQKELSFKEIKNVLNQLRDLNVLALRLFGGEPLLFPRFLEVVDLLKHYPFRTTLTTNGSLITEEIAKHLKNSNIDMVHVSLDGPKKIQEEICGVPHSFDKVFSGIQILKRNGLRVGIQFVLSSINIDYFYETLDIAADLKIDIFKLLRLSLTGKAKDQAKDINLSYKKWKEFYLDLTNRKINKKLAFDKISIVYFNCNQCNWDLYYPLPPSKRKELLKTAWGIDLGYFLEPRGSLQCDAGINCLAILANGDVYPCDLMRGIKRLKAGDIRKQSIKDIWHNSKALHLLRNLRRQDQQGPCGKCDNPYCSGNCLSTAYFTAGSILESDMSCIKAKKALHST